MGSFLSTQVKLSACRRQTGGELPVVLGSVGKLRRRVRDRAIFRLAKLVPSDAEGTEAGDISFIVDAAGCSQAGNKPLEARSSFQTEPNFAGKDLSTISAARRSGGDAAQAHV